MEVAVLRSPRQRRMLGWLTVVAAIATLGVLLMSPSMRRYRLAEACATGDASGVRSALSRGVGVDEIVSVPFREDLYKMTPLMIASATQQVELVEWLIHNGADPNSASPLHQRTALHYAINNTHRRTCDQAAVLLLLLEAGADPNAQDRLGYTPLHLAYISDQKELQTILLVYGASDQLEDHAGSTPSGVRQPR